MKKVIAYLGANICYQIGESFSKLLKYEAFSFFYPSYKLFMTWSFQIQDWGKLKGPWENTVESDVKEIEE